MEGRDGRHDDRRVSPLETVDLIERRSTAAAGHQGGASAGKIDPHGPGRRLINSDAEGRQQHLAHLSRCRSILVQYTGRTSAEHLCMP